MNREQVPSSPVSGKQPQPLKGKVIKSDEVIDIPTSPYKSELFLKGDISSAVEWFLEQFYGSNIGFVDDLIKEAFEDVMKE